MTTPEARIILEAALRVDTGCPVCAELLIRDLVTELPEETWVWGALLIEDPEDRSFVVHTVQEVLRKDE